MNMTRPVLNYLAWLVGAISIMNSEAATTVPVDSKPTRPLVIELFTSQGCSSCRAAEALMGEYANNKDVLIVAFHVDYWDYLGWRDPFALPVSNERQVAYVDSLKLRTSFTPQSVVDGQISLVGSDRHSLQAALGVERAGIPIELAKSDKAISIVLPESETTARFDVNLIAYQTEASTAVPRGENAGHTLKEYNIVRKFQKLRSWNGQATTLEVPLSRIGKDANRVAVIIQKSNQGAVVGATSMAL